jgi:FixJ family two-component response regulator
MSASPETTPAASTAAMGRDASAMPWAAGACSTSVGPPWRVLIVDDEENVLSSLRRLLRREPYEIVTADSAEEGLRNLAAQPAQLVISDERMPDMTGTVFLREVRRRWPNTIRIILSGYSAVDTILAAINEGAVYKFLTKPWNDEELKLNIRRALEQYALEAENRRMACEIAEQNALLSELNAELAQRADDAVIGLDIAQELLDFADVGILAMDESGLMVGANRRARESFATTAGCVLGLSAAEVLPPELHAAVCGPASTGSPARAGELRLGDRVLQWRARPVRARASRGSGRGMIVTIWEVIV